jgi:hypothetical protein
MLTNAIKTPISKNFLYYFFYFLLSYSNSIIGMEIAERNSSSDSENNSGQHYSFSDPEEPNTDDEIFFSTDTTFDYYSSSTSQENLISGTSTQPSSETNTETSSLLNTPSSSQWSSHQSSPVLSHIPRAEKLVVVFTPRLGNINTSSQSELISVVHKSESLNTLQKTIFTNGNDKEISAFTIYKGTQLHTPSEFQFMLQLDQHFFRKAPLGEKFGHGIIGACFWPCVTFANAGVVMYTTADFLRIPYGQSGAIIQVTWLLTSHAPVYGRQFYRIAQSIGDSLTRPRPFKTTAEDDNPYSPRIYQKWHSHYLMNGGAFLAASIHATTSMFFFFLAEAPFPIFAWTTGGFVFLSELERYATRANLDIDRRFTQAYDAEEEKRQEALNKKDKQNFPNLPYGINKMREYLRRKTERFRHELENDEFANASYDIIRAEMDNAAKGDSINSEAYYFKMSLLFLRDLSFFGTFDHKRNIEKPTNKKLNISSKGTDSPIDKLNLKYIESLKKDKIIQNLEEQNQKLLNRKRMEKSLEPTFLDDVLSRVSSGLIDASWFARWAGTEYLLETTFIQLLSPDPTTAAIVALVLSGYEVLFKSSIEYSIQKKYFEGILRNPFSLRNHVTLPWLRKGVGGTALVNGVFSALGKTVASLLAFNRWQIPLPIQIVAVASEFVINTIDYAQFHEQESHSFITDLATAYSTNKKLEEISVTEKRLWLFHWSSSIIPYLETGFDGRTIQLLFQITQRAI